MRLNFACDLTFRIHNFAFVIAFRRYNVKEI